MIATAPQAVPRVAPSASPARPSVCIVAPHSFGIMADRPEFAHLGGGAETQLRLIAGGLVEQGYAVSVVVLDHGQAQEMTHKGIRLFRAHALSDGWPVVRFIHPRMTAIWKAMERADADVYVQRCADGLTGVVARWCRSRQRSFVFSTASDADCDPDLPNLKCRRDKWLFRYGFSRADRVVCQTERQRDALLKNFGIHATGIASCAEAASSPTATRWHPDGQDRARVLWVGRFAPVKRLELLLDVAELAPEIKFDVVGPATNDREYATELTDRAGRLSNVVLHGHVPHSRVGEYYDRATVLMCTSRWEGFPNTFLEAWGRGRPTITTVDPDELVRRKGLGMVAAAARSLAACARALATDGSAWRRASEAASRHFAEQHTVSAAISAYEDLLGGLPWQRTRHE